MRLYITPEEYKEAESNGIDARNLNKRIRSLKWDKRKAITTPINCTILTHWAKIANERGIGYSTLRARLHRGWDPMKAATHPVEQRRRAT